MATKPSEPNRFITLRKQIASLHKDIAFLKKCTKHHITPVSHKIIVKTHTPTRIIQRLEQEFIKDSIKKLYSKLNDKTLESYFLHLKLAKTFPIEFPPFLTKVKVAEKCESERKRKLLDKKFRQLKLKVTRERISKPTVQPLEGFVVNRSTQEFTPNQLKILQNGLNYAVAKKPNTEQIIIDIETATNTCQLPIQDKSTVRTITEETINKATQNTQTNNAETRIIKELKDKPVYYTKADKGNAIVILDKEDYDNIMTDKLNNGPYRKQRKDPLPDIVKRVDKTIKECKPIFEDLGKLKVPNPTLPRIKGQPKIHKPGNEIREIISAEGSPTHKIAKWLVKEFQTLHIQTETRQVQSTKEFIEKLQNSGNVEDDEIMVSFDVAALFPSVPVKEAICLLEDWLLRQHSDSTWKTKVRTYLKLTRLCMEENYFTFRGEFFKQTKGAPMGNPLSPFLCELFMANLENELKHKNILPRRWWRYVDDVFSIIKRESLPIILEAINSAHRNIRFTYEQEKDGKLPFLDVLIVRESNLLTFEIYRKPTNTRRVIPNTSNHSHEHKAAAFHHMINRLETLPLSNIGKKKELDYIFETARLNGYPDSTVQNIIDKRRKNQHRQSMTTLTPIKEDLRRVSVDFDYNLTRPLRSKLKKFGIDLVFTSRNNQLKTRLGNTKDPVENLGKSGVYKVSCSHCDKVYIGQTKRTLDTRFKEHLAEVTKATKDTGKGLHYHFKSKVAEHIFNEEHPITKDDIKIVRHITNPWKLDVAESLEIYKQKTTTLLNRDQGNGYSWLFRLLPTKQRPSTTNNIPENTENIPTHIPTRIPT